MSSPAAAAIDPPGPPGPGPGGRTLWQALLDNGASAPDSEAVIDFRGRCTYDELLTAARQVAGALCAEGVGRGDRVALLTDNRIEWLEVAFGCAALGGWLTPYNTWVKTWDLEHLLDHSQPTVLVTLDRLGRQDFLASLRELVPEVWEAPPGQWSSQRFPQLSAVVVVGADVPQLPVGAQRYEHWRSAPAPFADEPAGLPDDVAMVLYTSGSTSRPKAVPLVHRDLLDNGFQIGERQGLGPADRVFLASPLCWAFGSANAMMAAWTHRSALVLQPQFDAAGAIALLERESCTAVYTLPVMTHAMLADPAFRPERLATVRKGLTLGSPSEFRQAAERLGVDQICNIYGSTEIYGNCCVTPHDAPLEQRAGGQGPALAGVELRIADRDGTELPTGEVGEILVRGRVTPGYLDPDRRPQSVVDEEGFFHTGDLGSLDADGWLTFASRATEMIKTAGVNVSPAEVEEFLREHPDVVEVAVTGGLHPVRGEQVVAFVRLTPGNATTPDALREWCRERIAGYKVPAVIVPVEAMPTTETGKLARKTLRERADEALVPIAGAARSGG